MTRPTFQDHGDLQGAGYATRLTDGGTYHIAAQPDSAAALLLGQVVDFETDGQPNATATGDDVNGTPDDEDGVQLVQVADWLIGSGALDVTLMSASARDACLLAFIDWGLDADFDDAVTAGGQTVADAVIVDSVTLPAGSTTTRYTFLTPAVFNPDVDALDIRLRTRLFAAGDPDVAALVAVDGRGCPLPAPANSPAALAQLATGVLRGGEVEDTRRQLAAATTTATCQRRTRP